MILASSVGDYSDFLLDDRITKALNYGDAVPVQDGEIPGVVGVGLFRTQNVSESFIMHRDAIGLVVRSLPTFGNGKGGSQTIMSDPETGLSFRMSSFYDWDAGGEVWRVELLYGISKLRDELGVRLTNV